jgi:hypothetical protein
MGGTPHPFLPDNAVTVSWSPDSTRVVYHLQDDGDSTFVADRTGANARLIVRRNANEHNHFPIWSIDGLLHEWHAGNQGKWTSGVFRRKAGHRNA